MAKIMAPSSRSFRKQKQKLVAVDGSCSLRGPAVRAHHRLHAGTKARTFVQRESPLSRFNGNIRTSILRLCAFVPCARSRSVSRPSEGLRGTERAPHCGQWQRHKGVTRPQDPSPSLGPAEVLEPPHVQLELEPLDKKDFSFNKYQEICLCFWKYHIGLSPVFENISYSLCLCRALKN